MGAAPKIICALLGTMALAYSLYAYSLMTGKAMDTMNANEQVILLKNAEDLYREAAIDCGTEKGITLPELKTMTGNSWDVGSPWRSFKCTSFNAKYVVPTPQECERRWYNITEVACATGCSEVRGSVYRKREANALGNEWFQGAEDNNVFPTDNQAWKNRDSRVDMRLPYLTDPTNGVNHVGMKVQFSKTYFSFDFIRPPMTMAMIRNQFPHEVISSECFTEANAQLFADALVAEAGEENNVSPGVVTHWTLGIDTVEQKPDTIDCDAAPLGAYKIEMRCNGKAHAGKKFIGTTDCIDQACGATWGPQAWLWTLADSGRRFWHWDDDMVNSTEVVIKNFGARWTALLNTIKTRVEAPFRKNIYASGAAAALLYLVMIILIVTDN